MIMHTHASTNFYLLWAFRGHAGDRARVHEGAMQRPMGARAHGFSQPREEPSRFRQEVQVYLRGGCLVLCLEGEWETASIRARKNITWLFLSGRHVHARVSAYMCMCVLPK